MTHLRLVKPVRTIAQTEEMAVLVPIKYEYVGGMEDPHHYFCLGLHSSAPTKELALKQIREAVTEVLSE